MYCRYTGDRAVRRLQATPNFMDDDTYRIDMQHRSWYAAAKRTLHPAPEDGHSLMSCCAVSNLELPVASHWSRHWKVQYCRLKAHDLDAGVARNTRLLSVISCECVGIDYSDAMRTLQRPRSAWLHKGTATRFARLDNTGGRTMASTRCIHCDAFTEIRGPDSCRSRRLVVPTLFA
jgi:hypothetical protein